MASLSIKDDNMCQTCKWSVRIVEDALCDPAATDFAVHFVEQHICPALGDQCVAMADSLIPVAVEWFRAFVSPEQLCGDAKVCPSTLLVPTSPKTRLPYALRDTLDCALCKKVVADTQASKADGLRKPETELFSSCTKLPAPLSSECKTLVQQRLGLLLPLLEHGSTTKVCELSAFCTSWLANVQAPPFNSGVVALLSKLQNLPRGAKNSACDNCKMAVLEAHSLVTNPSYQEDLTTYVKQLCTAWTSMPDDCSSYVDTYAPMLFSFLDQYLSGDTLCVVLGVCPPNTLSQFLVQSYGQF